MNQNDNYKGNKRLKRILLAVILITFGIVITFYLVYRQTASDTESLLNTLEREASMHLKNVQQSAVKDGIEQWHLDAASAQLVEKGTKMILTKPAVVFFLKNGDQIRMTAKQGILMVQSNDIDVSGDVMLEQNRYTMKTDALKYRHDKRLLFSDSPVSIIGKAFELKADSLSYDLNTNLTSFDGHVEGNIRESVSL